jgi:hypothetical protein
MGWAMHPQALSHLPAGLRLPTGHPRAYLEPWLLPTVICTWYALLHGRCRPGNEAEGVVHRLRS